MLTLGILSWKQCHAYTNVETLWLDVLKKKPNSYIAHGEMVKIYYEQGKFNEAKFHLEQAIKNASYIKSVIPFKYAIYLFNMGYILQNEGRLDEATVYYQNSLDIWEHFIGAHYQIGLILAKKGNVVQARFHFFRALEIARDNKDAKLNKELCPQLDLNEFKGEIYRQLNLLEEKNKSLNNLRYFH